LVFPLGRIDPRGSKILGWKILGWEIPGWVSEKSNQLVLFVFILKNSLFSALECTLFAQNSPFRNLSIRYQREKLKN